MDVMFDSDSIVVISLAVTYLTLKSGSKPRYWQNAANVPFWHRWDVSFRQFCSNKQSHGIGHRTTVKGRRAKIIVRGTSTGHGKYAVMV